MIGHYSQLAHQGTRNPSRSMCNGGGGGGDSTDTRYANLDQLYGVQKQASEYMLNNAMPHIPGLTQNSSGMVDEAMSGRLGDRMRGRAAADADAAMGTSTEAMNQNLSRYGINPNSGLFADMARKNSIEGAANKVSAMGKASQWAEDQKWNRNANFYGQVMGMNNGAMLGVSSAGAGMAGIANNQANMDAKNAAGFGQAGSAFASSLTKADGGYIKAPKLASGGDAWEAYKKANPVQASSGSGGKRTGGLKAMLGGAAPQLLGAGLKDVFSDKSKIAGGLKGAYKYLSKPGSDATGAPEGITYGGDTVADMPANMIDGSLYADAASYAGAGYEGASAGYDVATGAPEGITYGGDIAADGIGAAASAAPAAAEGVGAAAEAAPSVFESIGSLLAMKNGGAVKKPGLHLAIGGLAKTGVNSSNTVDNQSMAKMDASGDMSVAKMGTTAKSESALPTHAKPIASETGRTDGMGESSSNDPDGFGKEGADNRHMAGKTTMQVVGNMFGPGYGGIIGGALAEVVHPIMEPVTRALVTQGDKYGGVTGAMTADPAGAIASGKYSAKELFRGAGHALAGHQWAGKFLADGGRVDHTDGGDVQGAGTETSDDIPAWLSDGEYVLNAEAVKMVGKDKLEQINNAGLKKRDGGVKLAGGGFLGGNLGIAMGAGVDEWNRQKANDRADKADLRADAADARQQETHTAQMKETERRNTELAAAGKVWQGAQSVFQGGSDAAAQSLLERYNANDAGMGYNDGHTAKLEKTDKGYVVTRTAPDGKVVGSQAFTPQQVQQEHMRSVYSQLAAINPAYGEKLMGFLENQNREDTRKTERGEDMTHRDKREGVTDGHWQQNFDLQKQQVGNSGFGNALAQQRLNMAKEEYASGAPDRQLKSTLSTLNLALLNANTEQERAPIAEKISALNKLLHTKNEVMPHYSTVPDGMGGATVVVGDRGGNIATHKIKNGQVVSNTPKPAQQQLPPPADQRVPGKTEFNHPTKGRVLWVEEGGQLGWKSVGK